MADRQLAVSYRWKPPPRSLGRTSRLRLLCASGVETTGATITTY